MKKTNMRTFEINKLYSQLKNQKKIIKKELCAYRHICSTFKRSKNNPILHLQTIHENIYKCFFLLLNSIQTE